MIADLITLEERPRYERECAMAKLSEKEAANNEITKITRTVSTDNEKAVMNCVVKAESPKNQSKRSGNTGLNAEKSKVEANVVANQSKKNKHKIEEKFTRKRPYAQSTLQIKNQKTLPRYQYENIEPARKKSRNYFQDLPSGKSLVGKFGSMKDEIIDGNMLKNVMKREKDKEIKRRKREQIRQNPELNQMQKTKDHERYIRRKQTGSIKLIGQLSVSAVKRKRKAWSRNSSEYRRRRTLNQDGKIGPTDNIKPESNVREKRHKLGRKLSKQSNEIYRKTQKNDHELLKMKPRADQYAKRYHESDKQLGEQTLKREQLDEHNHESDEQLATNDQTHESDAPTHTSDEQQSDNDEQGGKDNDHRFQNGDHQVDYNKQESKVQESESQEESDLSLDPTHPGQRVAAVYNGKWYPGVVQHLEGDMVTISFMKRHGKKFTWPLEQDIQRLPKQEPEECA